MLTVSLPWAMISDKALFTMRINAVGCPKNNLGCKQFGEQNKQAKTVAKIPLSLITDARSVCAKPLSKSHMRLARRHQTQAKLGQESLFCGDSVHLRLTTWRAEENSSFLWERPIPEGGRKWWTMLSISNCFPPNRPSRCDILPPQGWVRRWVEQGRRLPYQQTT